MLWDQAYSVLLLGDKVAQLIGETVLLIVSGTTQLSGTLKPAEVTVSKTGICCVALILREVR